MANIVLPQVERISEIQSKDHFLVEQNGAIKRYMSSNFTDVMNNKFNTLEELTNNKLNEVEAKMLNLTAQVEEALANIKIIELNYSVVAFSDIKTLLASSNIMENTIGIVTTTPISTWQLGADRPSNPIEGMVWIETGTSQTAGSFASLKLNNNTFAPVNPWAAYQYINYNWILKDAMIYINSLWSDFNTIPIFTYTGEYEILNDNNEPIVSSNDNWKIKFLTSGILTFQSLNGAKDGIDVFLVGGGGGGCSWSSTSYYGPGGGGGYTTTKTTTELNTEVSYEIVIGQGGTGSTGGSNSSPATNGTASTAFSFIANGGTAPEEDRSPAGSGGSSGAPLVSAGSPHAGFADGAGNGEYTLNDSWIAGKGQGTTTREFGEATNTLYSTGGAANSSKGKNGKPNTGDGGGGANSGTGGNGGSGIVIIRNTRKVL